MGAEILKAEAISHLEEISDDGISAMAKFGSVAVVLPTTAYILRLKSPPVRQMIDEGVIVALGTDFNPNAFCLSMVRMYVRYKRNNIRTNNKLSTSYIYDYCYTRAIFCINYIIFSCIWPIVPSTWHIYFVLWLIKFILCGPRFCSHYRKTSVSFLLTANSDAFGSCEFKDEFE